MTDLHAIDEALKNNLFDEKYTTDDDMTEDATADDVCNRVSSIDDERTEGATADEVCNYFIEQVRHMGIDVHPISDEHPEEHLEIIYINGMAVLFRKDYNKTETEETYPKLSIRCVKNEVRIQEAAAYYADELAKVEVTEEKGVAAVWVKKRANHTDRLSLALKH